MSKTLNINITSMSPDRFAKDPSSTATEATVTDKGVIDVSSVLDSVTIAWTIAAGVNETFESLSPAPGPIKFRTTQVPPTDPPAGVFGSATLSTDKKTVTVSDANASGETTKVFQYTLYENHVRLICSAAGGPQELYPTGDGSFQFERTVSRLMEMQSQDYLSHR